MGFRELITERECLTSHELLAYASNRLSKEEHRSVELHLADCELCTEALEGYEMFHNEDLFLNEIDAMHLEIERKTSGNNESSKAKIFPINFKNGSMIWSVAAAFVLLIASSIIFFTQSNPSEKLFRQNYEAYPNLMPITRGEADTADPLKNALALYENGEYQNALNDLSNNNNVNQDTIQMIQLYRGICFMELNEISKAIELFESSSKDNNEFAEVSSWYLSLCYLKTKQKDLAKKELENLIQRNGDYKKRAEKVLSKL